ncbi:dehydrogenase, partial [Microbacterium sp. SUBG005]
MGRGHHRIGAGVAALHAPTLARVADDFRLVHVSDAGSGRAAVIADRFGARSSTGIDELLADP